MDSQNGRRLSCGPAVARAGASALRRDEDQV